MQISDPPPPPPLLPNDEGDLKNVTSGKPALKVNHLSSDTRSLKITKTSIVGGWEKKQFFFSKNHPCILNFVFCLHNGFALDLKSPDNIVVILRNVLNTVINLKREKIATRIMRIDNYKKINIDSSKLELLLFEVCYIYANFINAIRYILSNFSIYF